MKPIKIIFNSNRGSCENSELISSEFQQLTYSGNPIIFSPDLNNLELYGVQEFIKQYPNHYILGYLGYDVGYKLLKGKVDKNKLIINLPAVFLMAVEKVEIINPKSQISNSNFHLDQIPNVKELPSFILQQLVSKTAYVENVARIKNHIQLGDVYELNYCIPFIANNIEINPVLVWENLCMISPMPFACFIDHPDFSIISASPERFIKKKNNQLFIQPMKGTKGKGASEKENLLLKEELRNDPKERTENVMIVDLTRNDLSKVAKKGTVKVDELFGVYSFQSIHQMISTVSCTIEKDTSFSDIIGATFPMGSMTGAPKKRAMELIDQYECFSRGPFSGMLGYIDPRGDFDFSVMIRTIFYDKKNKKIFIAVGSAITSKSDVEKEYEECLIKLQPLLQALNATI